MEAFGADIRIFKKNAQNNDFLQKEVEKLEEWRKTSNPEEV